MSKVPGAWDFPAPHKQVILTTIFCAQCNVLVACAVVTEHSLGQQWIRPTKSMILNGCRTLTPTNLLLATSCKMELRLNLLLIGSDGQEMFCKIHWCRVADASASFTLFAKYTAYFFSLALIIIKFILSACLPPSTLKCCRNTEIHISQSPCSRYRTKAK